MFVSERVLIFMSELCGTCVPAEMMLGSGLYFDGTVGEEVMFNEESSSARASTDADVEALLAPVS